MKIKKLELTISKRIFIPLLLVAVLQIVFLFGVFQISGINSSFDKNARGLLQETTRNKYQLLETQMLDEWTSFGSLEESIGGIIENELNQENKTWNDLATDAKLNERIINKSADHLIMRLRSNRTTGIFMIINGVGIDGDQDSYAGIYLRNRDPGTETSDNSDLTMLRGLPPVSRELGISLESFWEPVFRFEGGRANAENDFFFYPLDAVQLMGTKDSTSCCYWSHVSHMGNPNDISVITYTIPLINHWGQVYGVLGVELNTKYLMTQVAGLSGRASSNVSFYVGITEDGGKTYEQISCSNAKYQSSVMEAKTQTEKKPNWQITVANIGKGRNTLEGFVMPLQLYDNNAPYTNEQWVLIGFQEKKTLLSEGNRFKRLMFLGFGIILLLDILVALLSTYSIAFPIKMFARKLDENKEYQELEISHTKITELDTLADAIMNMNHGIVESAKRTSKLIELSGLPVGVYEMKKNSEVCYCSDGFFKLLDCVDTKPENNLLSVTELENHLHMVTAVPFSEDTYQISIQNKIHYIRVIAQNTEDGTIGTILDVTKEIEDRKRIEHERDYDMLTGIWNRRAFETNAEQLFSKFKTNIGIAGMIMFDLDNLKSINDVYGHDCGDMYIKAFAQGLQQLQSKHVMVARRSGDEFYALCYGYETREEVFEVINNCWEKANEQVLRLPDHTECKIRVSAGYAWYPEDADDFQKLVHYADFAMYYAKQTLKGSIRQFNKQDYSQEAFLFNGHEALNRLIENKLVRYMFQPIVSAKTGALYGYEILMRSMVEELKTPDLILRMAKSQSKLNHIEKLTWFEGLSAVREGIAQGYVAKDAKIFVNTIANQILLDADERELEREFGDLFDRVVLEVTEGESNNTVFTNHKLEMVQAYNGQIAIDDYGTGYNSELALVMLPAQIVKIDMTFVRDVDTDKDKQMIIQNLMKFARKRNIAVLAEGVETRAELEVLIGYGVDYLQGYYVARPAYVPTINEGVQEEIRAIYQVKTKDNGI